MKARTFRDDFNELARSLRAETQDEDEWTRLVTGALASIARKHDYHARSKGFGKGKWDWTEHDGHLVMTGEFKWIDVAYFSRELRYATARVEKRREILARKRHWKPLAFIEHENEATEEKAIEDFWKVCLFAVPLRVFIGYGTNAQHAEEIGAKLQSCYGDFEILYPPGAETLMLMGFKSRDDKDYKWWGTWNCVRLHEGGAVNNWVALPPVT